MKRSRLNLLAVAVTMGSAACAMAQTIEISSDSIGTMVVAPSPNSTSSTVRRGTREATVSRTLTSGQNGVDLGIQRNPDGTLFDALDPRKNPAAANGGVSESNEANTALQQSGAIAPTGRRPGTSELGNPTSAGMNNGNSGTNNGRSFSGVSGGTGINNSGSSGNGLRAVTGNDNAAQNGARDGTGINNSGSSGNGLGAAAGNDTAQNGAVGGGLQGAGGGGSR